jgi:hypothetical protein
MSRVKAALFFSAMISLLAVAGAQTSWTFVAMADSRGPTPNDAVGVNVDVVSAMAVDIAALSPRPLAALMLGDLVVGDLKNKRTVTVPNLRGMLKNWRDAMAPLDAAKIPLYCVRGNHETYSTLWYGYNNDTTDWMAVFGDYLPKNGPDGERGLSYYFTINDSLFLCVDNYPPTGEKSKIPTVTPVVNQTWIDKVLSEQKGKYTNLFVFAHVPVRQVDISSMLAWDLKMRNKFVSSIIAAGCKAYFCGHDHFYVLSELVSDDFGPTGANAIYQNLIGMAGACGTAGQPDTWDKKYKNIHKDPVNPITCQPVSSDSPPFPSAFFGYAIITVTGTNVTQTIRVYDSSTKSFYTQPNSAYTLSSFPSQAGKNKESGQTKDKP